jgi:hypothetical protein
MPSNLALEPTAKVRPRLNAHRYTDLMVERAVVILVVVLVFISSSASTDRGDGGNICIAPLPSRAYEVDHNMPNGKPQRREPAYKFSVQVDSSAPVEVPTGSRPHPISGLARGERHLLRIRDNGVPIEAVWFTFDGRGGSTLCLEYVPWYQTWRLDPSRTGAAWCKCKSGG